MAHPRAFSLHHLAADGGTMMPLDGRLLAAAITGGLAMVGLASLAIGVASRDEPPPRLQAPVVALAPVDAALDAPSPIDASTPAPSEPYPLDDFARDPSLASAGCPEIPLVEHAGDEVPWRPALRVHPAFLPSVRDVERALIDAAQARYGRAPIALLSASSHRCRTMRANPTRLSEHALGNALDVRGIVLADGDGTREVTVREHWGGGSVDDAFLHDVARAVLDRARMRGVIGPPTRDHLDHFHFDHGPSRFVAIELE